MSDGLKTAVDLLMDGRNGPDGDEPAQLDMLGLPAIQVVADGKVIGERRVGPGRPPGARNRRTQEWVDYLQRRYPSPLEGLLQMGAMGVADLAEALDCTPLEAWQEIRNARAQALPYMHQRQPLAVNIHQSGVVQLVFENPAATTTMDGIVFDATIVENQALKDGYDDQV